MEVNFENFPQLIDAMGGITYTGGCIVSRLDGGSRNGGYTLRLPAGTHHLNGKQALALARTRENLCEPNETDIQREQHQQALFNDMKSRLMSPSSFLRLPLIAWNAPPAIISDMSGPELLGLFAALSIGGTPPTRVLTPTGAVTLPSGEDGLTVSAAARHAAVSPASSPAEALDARAPRAGARPAMLPVARAARAAGAGSGDRFLILGRVRPWRPCRPWASLEAPSEEEEDDEDDEELSPALSAESPSLLERPRLRLP